MSKLNIGVGDEFPLDESTEPEERHACKHDHHHHAMRCHGRGRHHRHHGRGHHEHPEQETR